MVVAIKDLLKREKEKELKLILSSEYFKPHLLFVHGVQNSNLCSQAITDTK